VRSVALLLELESFGRESVAELAALLELLVEGGSGLL
jgi:hypothetical protein